MELYGCPMKSIAGSPSVDMLQQRVSVSCFKLFIVGSTWPGHSWNIVHHSSCSEVRT